MGNWYQSVVIPASEATEAPAALCPRCLFRPASRWLVPAPEGKDVPEIRVACPECLSLDTIARPYEWALVWNRVQADGGKMPRSWAKVRAELKPRVAAKIEAILYRLGVLRRAE